MSELIHYKEQKLLLIMNKIDIIQEKIAHSTIIKAPIETVYEAFTTAKGLDSWFTKGSIIDQYVGGKIYFRWETEKAEINEGIIEDRGEVLEIKEPHKFVFQWYPDNSSYSTTVIWEFEETKVGTKVSVKESGFQNTPTGRRALLDCAAGWGEALTMAKYYIEHGITY